MRIRKFATRCVAAISLVVSLGVAVLGARSYRVEDVAVLSPTMRSAGTMYYAASFRGQILLQYFDMVRNHHPIPWSWYFEHASYADDGQPGALYIRTAIRFRSRDLALAHSDGSEGGGFAQTTQFGSGFMISHHQLLAITVFPMLCYILIGVLGAVYRRALSGPKPQ